jgi:hypothetical protein
LDQIAKKTKKKDLDKRDGVARRSDNTFEQGELFADELMRRDNHQNGGACKNIQPPILKIGVAWALTSSGVTDVRNCNDIFREKSPRKVPAGSEQKKNICRQLGHTSRSHAWC